MLSVTYFGDYEKGFEIFIPQRQNGWGKRRNRGGGTQVKSLIGVCNENSIGVPQNYAKAVKWLGRRI